MEIPQEIVYVPRGIDLGQRQLSPKNILQLERKVSDIAQRVHTHLIHKAWLWLYTKRNVLLLNWVDYFADCADWFVQMNYVGAIHKINLDVGSILVHHYRDPMTHDTQVQNEHSRSALDIQEGSHLILNLLNLL